MGVIGGNRGEIHKGIAQRLADLNLIIRPRLTIIDATRILLRHGPTGGDLKDVKVLDTLVASADPVAADAYATTLFGMKPEQLGSTVAAAKFGLGEMDLSKVKIVEGLSFRWGRHSCLPRADGAPTPGAMPTLVVDMNQAGPCIHRMPTTSVDMAPVLPEGRKRGCRHTPVSVAPPRPPC